MRLDSDGLTTETQEEIRDALNARLRSVFGATLSTAAEGLIGQIVNIVSETNALVQQAALAMYRSFDPAGALGRALDARMGLTGTTRQGETRSSVYGRLACDAPTTAPAGMLVRNDTDSSLWEISEATICGAGITPATFVALDAGPLEAPAGTTWSLVSVVPHVTSFTNPALDAVRGRAAEQDGPARQRRLRELYAQGRGPVAAIEGAVSQVDGVLYARCYDNPDVYPYDDNSIPFKAFCLVLETFPTIPTADLRQTIADAIWGVTGAGGQSMSIPPDYVESVIDSEGREHVVTFDMVTAAQIVIEVDLVTSTSEIATTPNVTDIVAAAILETALAEHAITGRDVLALDYQGVVSALLAAGTIRGVDAVAVRLAISPGAPTAVAKLDIGIRYKPAFDGSDITVIEV